MTVIAIVGAGRVGTSIAYATIMQRLVERIVLIDALPEKAHGEALDLAHGASFVPEVEITDGPLAQCAGADVVVIAAGAKQKLGQSRLDLARVNADAFREIIPQVTKAAPQAHLLIVSNPVDVLTHLALRLSGLSPERVIGSGTVLDTSRFRYVIGRHFDVSPANVHAYIIGEHGDSEVPLWSSAQIGNVPLAQLRLLPRPALDEEAKQRIFEETRGAAGTIIKAKGATNWAIGMVVARILRAILRDEHVVLSVSRRLEGYHGVSGICLSAPTLIGRRGAETHLLVPCDAQEKAAFQRSSEVVRKALAEVEE